MNNFTRLLREAVLLSFRDPMPAACDVLRHLPVQEWQRLLHWLDTSGLALYFLERATQTRLSADIPKSVLERLQLNLGENTMRTKALALESAKIQESFAQAGFQYAVLKGFSLWPVSVPRMELRSQLDLDFLIATSDAPAAREILQARNYSLRAISGQTWEFKSNEPGIPTLENLYKTPLQRSVELHLETPAAGRPSLLARSDTRELHGMRMPVLGQADLFLGQGLHLCKHVCSEHSRTAHLLEFYRHILVRFHDIAFWSELQQLAEQTAGASEALGLVTHLIGHLMGPFAPVALTCWTVDRLPVPARLWVELYGRRCIFGDPPGNKLYLLLRSAVPGPAAATQRSTWRTLLPAKLPPRVFPDVPGQTQRERIEISLRETLFRGSRLRFHLVEGLLYLCASVQWQLRLRFTLRFTASGPSNPALARSAAISSRVGAESRTAQPPPARVSR